MTRSLRAVRIRYVIRKDAKPLAILPRLLPFGGEVRGADPTPTERKYLPARGAGLVFAGLLTTNSFSVSYISTCGAQVARSA